MNKKILSLILVCLLAITLVGCNTETGVEADKVDTEVTQEETKDVKEEIESRGIEGSHYINPRMGLEKRGFPEKGLEDLSEMNCQIYDNEMTDVSTGMQYNCSLTIENDNTIITAIFETMNLNGLDKESFINNATSYLKYCSSIPYETMDAEKVNNWIDENIGTVGGGEKGANITIGDAEFYLYGTNLDSGIPGVRTIEIRKSK